jgi:hypothetical protein
MTDVDPYWEKRMSDLWAVADEYDEPEFLSLVDELVAELPAGHAVGLFERALAFDSAGRPDKAVALYKAAMEAGLEGERRRRAIVRMGNSNPP